MGRLPTSTSPCHRARHRRTGGAKGRKPVAPESARLSADGILSFALPLRLYVRFSGRDRIHPGDYRLVPGDTALGLLEKLERGDVIRYSITFPEGWTLTQWRALLAKERLLVPLTRTLSAADLAADLGHRRDQSGRLVFAQHLFFVAGDSDRDILLRAHRRLRDELDNAWRDRSAGLPYATPYEALIAASLVERETGLATEARKLAGYWCVDYRPGCAYRWTPR
ncbi:MAG: endolytic transglycosylase MltG [Gammaproteobacteria bacterium]|nr:endolytic transglycosylase MltG [Gammaproteobacteria bacterium]